MALSTPFFSSFCISYLRSSFFFSFTLFERDPKCSHPLRKGYLRLHLSLSYTSFSFFPFFLFYFYLFLFVFLFSSTHSCHPGIHQDYLFSAKGRSKLNLKHYLNKHGVTAAWKSKRERRGWEKGRRRAQSRVILMAPYLNEERKKRGTYLPMILERWDFLLVKTSRVFYNRLLF